MRWGAALVGGTALLVVLAAVPSAAGGSQGRLLVDETGLEPGREALVFAVVPLEGSVEEVPVEVDLTARGPEGTAAVERTREVTGSGSQLVTLAWKPGRQGTYELAGTATVAGETVELEERAVEVTSDGPSPGPARDPLAPGVASGTIQWGIVLTVLFLVAHRNHRSR